MRDGIGTQHTDAKSFSDSYFDNGCVLNLAGLEGTFTPVAEINANAFFDVARRYSQYIRCIPRTHLRYYAVIDGKSVLWFKRAADALGTSTSRVPITEGAAEIQPFQTYEVDGVGGDQIDYNSVLYVPGDTFEGVSGADDFTTLAGTPTVYFLNRGTLGTPAGQDYWFGIADAIATEAPENGWSNEWLIGFEWLAYHSSESSIWKPGAYSDYFPLGNPAGFYSPEIANDEALCYHVAYGQRIPGMYGGNLIAEMPSGWNYSRLGDAWTGNEHLNKLVCADIACVGQRRDFYRSKQIYAQDYEIESVETVEENGETLVKVTLTTRVQNTYGEGGGAPPSVDKDFTTWEDLPNTEPYRTVENGLRCYILNQYSGINYTAIVGDNAINSTVQTLTDNPYATIYPVTYLTKLIPTPHDDGNDRQDSEDTPLWHDAFSQMDLYLRAMCEGFVDQDETVERNACSYDDINDTCTFLDVGMFDYTFENLCYRAFNGRWLYSLPTVETDYIDAEDTRSDKPAGYGPMPNTVVSSEVFNQFSKAINLLTMARVDLPFTLQYRYWIYTQSAVTEIDGPAQGDATCGNANCGATGRIAYYGAGPAADTLFTSQDWTDVTGVIDGFTGSSISMDSCATDPSKWALGTERLVTEWRFEFDRDAAQAIPVPLRDLLSTRGGTLWCAFKTTRWQTLDRDSTDYDTCGATGFGCDFGEYRDNTVWCSFANAGTIDFGELAPASWFWTSRRAGAGECEYGSEQHLYLTPLTTPQMYVSVPLVDD